MQKHLGSISIRSVSLLVVCMIALTPGIYAKVALGQNQQQSATDNSQERNAQELANAFDKLFGQWKQILDQLRTVRAQYETAEEAELPALREKYRTLLDEGKQLIPKLRATAIAAYSASPNADEELSEFLLTVLTDDIAKDNYEPAFEIGKALMEGHHEDARVADLAGTAAFATNHFDLAEKWLRAAQENGTLDKGGNFLSAIPQYQDLWVEEHKLRAQEAKADDLPRVELTTNQGVITVELFENEAPGAVGNFISLVEQGFYDGLIFHRVIPGFMAQGGCPEGTGTGGPGYTIYCEVDKPNHRKHFRGSLSMAHAGKDTGGSQFFLNFVPTPWLNGKHTVFGRVIDGFDVLAKLRKRDPSNPDQSSADRIVDAKVLRKRDHVYSPNKVL